MERFMSRSDLQLTTRSQGSQIGLGRLSKYRCEPGPDSGHSAGRWIKESRAHGIIPLDTYASSVQMPDRKSQTSHTDRPNTHKLSRQQIHAQLRDRMRQSPSTKLLRSARQHCSTRCDNRLVSLTGSRRRRPGMDEGCARSPGTGLPAEVLL